MSLTPADLAQISTLISEALNAARIKISELPPAGAFPRTAVLPAVSEGSTVKVTLGGLLGTTDSAVATGQDLRGMDTTTVLDGSLFSTLGVVAPGDGGGGFWRYDAASVAADDTGTVIAPDSGVGRFLRIYDHGTVNVVWFGAIGDGIADDTLPIQNANAVLVDGGKLLFPLGKFRFTSALTFSANVNVIGCGMARSWPADTPIRPTVLLKDGSFTGITMGQNGSLQDVSVDGDTSNNGDGIYIGVDRVSLVNVGVFEMGGTGIVIGGGAGTAGNGWSLYNVVCGRNQFEGFHIQSTIFNANIGSAVNCLMWENTGDGWRVDRCFGNSFVDCYAEANGGHGYRVENESRFNSFISCGGESNGVDFEFETGSVNNSFYGSSNIFFPLDNGENMFLLAEGGGVGYPGWDCKGLVRAGNWPSTDFPLYAPNANGAFLTSRGFGAHGNSDAGGYPGIYWYDAVAPANQRGVEWYYDGPNLLLDFMDDDGSDRKNVIFITRAGTGSTAHHIFGLNATVEPILVRLGIKAGNAGALVYDNNADALGNGLSVGQLYRASGAGAAPLGTVMVVYAT